MKKHFIAILLLTAIAGCSNDDPVNPNNTGEVLVAQVPGDSVGSNGGSSTNISSINSQSINFTDRNNARITFYYSGSNNLNSSPFRIFYTQDTNEVDLFVGNNINPITTEQYIDTTISSPQVNAFFQYRINTVNLSGLSYFKFRDLKIYKK